MKQNSTRSRVFLSIVLLAALMVALQAQEAKTFEGELVEVNPATQMFTVQDSAGTSQQFTYNDQTQVSGGVESVQNLSSAKGSQVSVEYTTQAETHVAVRITIQSQ